MAARLLTQSWRGQARLVACALCEKLTYRVYRDAEGFGVCPCTGRLLPYVSASEAKKNRVRATESGRHAVEVKG